MDNQDAAPTDAPSKSPTLLIMPFDDAEEERLWDEIAEEIQRRS